LNDSCLELVRTYEAIRDNPSAVLRFLSPLKVDRDTYYALRGNRSKAHYKRSAEFIYLNKVGWNGLYRVNSSGHFNVPYGAPKTDNLIDADNLRSCAKSLAAAGITLSCGDFEDALSAVRPGDLVFLDPPYVTRHNNNGFIDYNERLFSWDDQERLAREAARLVELGATVIVSNANHEDVLRLFSGFELFEVGRSSTLAPSRSARTRVSEAMLLARGGT
jgi:DNA adenine methylase